MSYVVPLPLVTPLSDALVDLSLPVAVQLVLVGMALLVSAPLIAVLMRPGADSSALALLQGAQGLPGVRPRAAKVVPFSRRSRSAGARRVAKRRSSERGGTRAP